jgi:hypothetical protein
MFPHVSTAVNSTLLGCLRWLEVKVSDFSEKPVEKGQIDGTGHTGGFAGRPGGNGPWKGFRYQTHQNHGTDSMGDLRMAMFDSRKAFLAFRVG